MALDPRRRIRRFEPVLPARKPNPRQGCRITAKSTNPQMQKQRFRCSFHDERKPTCSRLQANSPRSCARHATSSIQSRWKWCIWQPVSILERGDSYEPLVDLMGGRVINVDLDGRETLNPWDLPEGESAPSNEKTAFLKNLTRHMLGDSHNSDTSLLDNVLTDAIGRVYKRCAIRYSNPIPTFNDLREELANWRDAEKMQRTIDEAHLAAIKLRSWTE